MVLYLKLLYVSQLQKFLTVSEAAYLITKNLTYAGGEEDAQNNTHKNADVINQRPII